MKAVPLMGSYISERTAAARVDARVKVLLLLALTAAVFVAQGLLPTLLWYALLALCIRAAHMSAASVIKALKPAAFVLAFTLLANLVSCDGSAEVALAGPMGLSITGAERGANAVLRIALLVGFALVVASSTTSTELADAFVRLLGPLKYVGVPVAHVGMVLAVALRFVPIVGEEFERIRMAQRARGVRFEEGTVRERVGRWASVFAPLIIGLLRRADALADSMTARCYAGQAQTPPKPLASLDWAVLAGGLCAIALVVAVSVLW